MMKKRMKQGSALVIAFALVLSLLGLTETYAASQVEQTSTYSMTLNLQQSLPDEIAAKRITANIYKVASVGVTGRYTAEEAFKTALEDNFKNLKATDNAAEWAAINEEAMALVETASVTPMIDEEIAVFNNKQFSVSGLMPGLYLIDVTAVTTEGYYCMFAPALISLPGVDAEEEWIKHVSATLKADPQPREGFLIIEKELFEYNATNNSAVFVFEVTGTTVDETPNNVYNEVVAIDFSNLENAPADDCVKVGPFKAGTEATVKEVYTGASYAEQDKTGTDGIKTVRIIADPALDGLKDDESTPSVDERAVVIAERLEDITINESNQTDVLVTFKNVHNDVPNGGTGIVNTFKPITNGWDFERDDQGQDTRPQQ